jgi:hypothetical protein
MVDHRLRELALGRLDPRPFHAEAIGVEPDAARQIEVLLPQQEAVGGIARRLLEHGRLLMFQVPQVAGGIIALDLVRRRGSAPQETLWKFWRSGCPGSTGEGRGGTRAQRGGAGEQAATVDHRSLRGTEG